MNTSELTGDPENIFNEFVKMLIIKHKVNDFKDNKKEIFGYAAKVITNNLIKTIFLDEAFASLIGLNWDERKSLFDSARKNNIYIIPSVEAVSSEEVIKASHVTGSGEDKLISIQILSTYISQMGWNYNVLSGETEYSSYEEWVKHYSNTVINIFNHFFDTKMNSILDKLTPKQPYYSGTYDEKIEQIKSQYEDMYVEKTITDIRSRLRDSLGRKTLDNMYTNDKDDYYEGYRSPYKDIPYDSKEDYYHNNKSFNRKY